MYARRQLQALVAASHGITGVVPSASLATALGAARRFDILPHIRRQIQSARWHRCDQCVGVVATRSEEHTSELQSPVHLVCRLLLEKKNKNLDYLQASTGTS